MRRLAPALACLALLFFTTSSDARNKRGDAMAAAEAAKEDFAGRNNPAENAAGTTAGSRVTTRKLHARVVEPGGADGSVAVEGERWIDGSDKPWNAVLDLSESEIVAKNRSAFDGRKQLGPGDLAPGHELVLMVEIPSMAIRKVKVVGSGS